MEPGAGLLSVQERALTRSPVGGARSGGAGVEPSPEVGDTLGWYLHAVGETPRLGPGAEAAPAERVAAGSRQARARMIEANLRLVVAVARAYCPQGDPAYCPQGDPACWS